MRPKLVLLSLVAMLAVVTIGASADESQTATGSGLTIYYGVVPAEIVRGHPPQHTEAIMHGGPPVGLNERHLVVAVFDAESGARVTDASISAEIYPQNSAMTKLALELMKIADTITYGGFFRAQTGEHETIRLLMHRPNSKRFAIIGFGHDEP